MNRLVEAVMQILSLAPATRAAATTNGVLGGTSGWIDWSKYAGALITYVFGAVDDTLTDIDLKVFHAENTSGAGTAISGAAIENLSGAGGAAVDNQIYQIDVRRVPGTHGQYIRPQIVAGPNGNAICAVHVQLYGPREEPVTQTPAAVKA